MSIVFGNFIEADENDESLWLTFWGKQHSLQERWRNNGISADFCAEYWTTFFPANTPESLARQLEIKGTIAYVANELLENTMKFCEADDQYPVSFSMSLSKRSLRLYAANSLSPIASQRFQEYIQRILTNDTTALYLQQLEQNALSTDNSISRLGLLTLVNDYHVELAWKFEDITDPPNRMTVTVMAMIRWLFEE